ncbi:unnamed protein product [Effrenium voratum]|nr:unnamed protein product [Effrenium voratum]
MAGPCGSPMRPSENVLPIDIQQAVEKALQRLLPAHLDRLLPLHLEELARRCGHPPGSERQGSERSERSQAEAAAPHVELQATRGEQEEEELLVAAEREDLELSQQLLEGHEPPIKLEQDPSSPIIDVIDLSDSLQSESFETEPAEDTQASQDRLLGDKPRLASRTARYLMAKHCGRPGANDLQVDLEVAENLSPEELHDMILDILRDIPDQVWKTPSRRNVLRAGEAFSFQMPLGLVTSAAFFKTPQIGLKTWQFIGLTKLILLYLKKLAARQGVELPPGTTLQVTKNLQTKEHKDKNNGGPSAITGFGDWKGGQTWIADPTGDDVIALSEDVAGIGAAGKMLLGRNEQIRGRLVLFDGKANVHCTQPFVGERYAVVLFSLGPGCISEMPPLNHACLAELGFNPPKPSKEVPQHLRRLAEQAARGEKISYHQRPPPVPRGVKRSAPDKEE